MLEKREDENGVRSTWNKLCKGILLEKEIVRKKGIVKGRQWNAENDNGY